MTLTRRWFLKILGIGAAGSAVAATLPAQAEITQANGVWVEHTVTDDTSVTTSEIFVRVSDRLPVAAISRDSGYTWQRIRVDLDDPNL